jgi:transcriptional regulator GlxA family with amidase domain
MVEALRLEAARRLLEESDLPVAAVAIRCGFGDEERLRRAMQRGFAVAPSAYRSRFRTGG